MIAFAARIDGRSRARLAGCAHRGTEGARPCRCGTNRGRAGREALRGGAPLSSSRLHRVRRTGGTRRHHGARDRPAPTMALVRAVPGPVRRGQPHPGSQLHRARDLHRLRASWMARALAGRRVLHSSGGPHGHRPRVGVRAVRRRARDRGCSLRHQAHRHRGRRPGALGARSEGHQEVPLARCTRRSGLRGFGTRRGRRGRAGRSWRCVCRATATRQDARRSERRVPRRCRGQRSRHGDPRRLARALLVVLEDWRGRLWQRVRASRIPASGLRRPSPLADGAAAPRCRSHRAGHARPRIHDRNVHRGT